MLKMQKKTKKPLQSTTPLNINNEHPVHNNGTMNDKLVIGSDNISRGLGDSSLLGYCSLFSADYSINELPLS